MNAEFFEALAMLEAERGLSAEYLLEKIKNAIVIAVKKDYDVEDDNVAVEIDPETGKFNVNLLKHIVEEVENPNTEISLEDAQAKKKTSKLGTDFVIPLKTKDFGRIAAQTAKHVIRQGLKEAERSQMYAEMQGNTHEIVSATVTNLDMARGIVTLELSKGGVATLPRNEQVPGEEYYEGQHLQVYVVDVRETERGPRMMISRTHPGLVKRMFEMEVPEIYDGTVEIKAISREAGARTKMAVWSKDENVDPVGACIGPRGARVSKIVDELGGEIIDIVRWSEDPAAFMSEALRQKGGTARERAESAAAQVRRLRGIEAEERAGARGARAGRHRLAGPCGQKAGPRGLCVPKGGVPGQGAQGKAHRARAGGGHSPRSIRRHAGRNCPRGGSRCSNIKQCSRFRCAARPVPLSQALTR